MNILPKLIPSLFVYMVRNTLLAAALTWTLGTLNAQTPFICEDQFFLTFTNNSGASLNEVIIDPQTNAVVFQSINNNLTYPVNAAGYRSTDNFIYCLNPSTRDLIRLDANGNSQILKSLALDAFTSYFAGDVSPDGKYLVLVGTTSFVNGSSVASELVKVDLEDPNYGFTTLAMNTTAQILDIAFHPVTDVLYGYDSNGQRLVRININTGVVSSNFPVQLAPVTTGSLFFDAYGNLFAYGSINLMGDQNRLFEINSNTGVAKLLTFGEAASSSDGCSCPYTIELLKTVDLETIGRCTNVEYTFELVNSSRRPHIGMKLEDKLPAGFTFVSVKDNPLGGNLMVQSGDDFFLLDNFELPMGNHKIVIIVNTGTATKGVHRNQAVLYNLPASLGSTRISDNPRTLVKDDSTALTIVQLPIGSAQEQKALCNNAVSLQLDASQYVGSLASLVRYSWTDGSDKPFFEVTMAGNYEVAIILGCDTARITYTVVSSEVEVTLAQNYYDIDLGDTISLKAIVFNTGDTTNYQWTTSETDPVVCVACPVTLVRPLNDQIYTVLVTNELGCSDTAQARVTVRKDREIYFPNVFKPGNNDENSYFYGFGPPYTVTKTLRVFSRWGEKMFESQNDLLNDAQLGWDGTFNGQTIQPGVYVWVAEVMFLDGETKIYSGDVTLVR